MRRRYSIVGMVLVAIAVATPSADARLRAPLLEAPAGGASVEAAPTLTWRPVSGAESYRYEVSADRQFGSIAMAANTRNTAGTFKATLIDGTYYWRVRAISAKSKASAWSSVRSFEKRWTAAPELQSPTTDFGAVWPAAPLVLRWSPIPHAASYQVVVATDPTLAQPVIGTAARPQETQGTVFAFPGTLNAGTYWWQVTPVDADGHKGAASQVGRFTWAWPTGLSQSIADLNPAVEVFDPLMSWSDVAGAARYDVEVNTSADFAPGSKVFSESVVGTAVSPRLQLRNNTYYWRARAVDPDGRAGGYVAGSFKKAFDDVAPTPTVRDLALRDADTPAAIGSAVSTPLLTWSPVPGAARYEVAIAPKPGGLCDWASPAIKVTPSKIGLYTTNPYLDVAAPAGSPTRNPGLGPAELQVHALADGAEYCARVRAVDGAGNVSEFAYLAGANNVAAFTYDAPPTLADGPCDQLPQPSYLEPAPGAALGRTPRFAWSAVPGARSYYVIVARDQALTNIIDLIWTDRAVYTPRDTYTDETTGYYWAVFPSPQASGDCPSDAPGTYPRFEKASVPPAPQGPPDGAAIPSQPVFRWSSAEGAKDYRIQVSRDAEFRDLVDNAVTASTAFAPSTTYPVDTALYWRVRARDAGDVELAWSPAQSFRRTLPTPVPDPANPSSGSTIPVFAWDPVPGAVSYDIHVDSFEGKTFDFTRATPRFTPVDYYGNGIWKWKVRANFPTPSGTVSGPYSAPVDYVRRILAPSSTRAVITAKRVVFSWDPDGAGKQYRLEVSRDDSFSDLIENVTTPNTSYAPPLEHGYEDGGRFYWRVAILDKGNNLGAFARGDLRLPPRLKPKASASLIFKGKRTALTITVRDPRGTLMRGATVKVSGAGVSVRRTTNKKGNVTLRIRPKRRGTIKVVATRKGYVSGETKVSVV